MLADVARLELVQAPGLPFVLPREFADAPRLTGRAAVALTVSRPKASPEPLTPAGGSSATITLTLDGYSAPLTAGNFAANVAARAYDGAALTVGPAAVLAGASVASGSSIPLEILPAGAFDPLYRSPVDVAGGELPTLPLSVFGAVAMARPAGGPPGTASAGEFFMFLYSREQVRRGMGGWGRWWGGWGRVSPGGSGSAARSAAWVAGRCPPRSPPPPPTPLAPWHPLCRPACRAWRSMKASLAFLAT